MSCSPNSNNMTIISQEEGASDDNPLPPDANSSAAPKGSSSPPANQGERGSGGEAAVSGPPGGESHKPSVIVTTTAANREARDEAENYDAPSSAAGFASDVVVVGGGGGDAWKKTKPLSVDLSQEETESDVSSDPVSGGSKAPNQTGGDEAVECDDFDSSRLQRRKHQPSATTPVDLTGEDSEDEAADDSDQVLNQESTSDTTKEANDQDAPTKAPSAKRTGEGAGDGEISSTEKSNGESSSTVKDQTAPAPMDADGATPTSRYSSSDLQALSTFTMALPPLASGEYDALLPTTKSSMMLKVKHKFVEGTATFNGYNQFPDGSKAPAELRSLCGNIGDRIIAVNGTSVLDKNGRDIISILRVCGKNKHVHLRFRLNVSNSSETTNPSEGEHARGQEQNEAHITSDVDGPQKASQSLAMHSLNQTKLPAEKKVYDADQALGRDDPQNNEESASTASSLNSATKDAGKKGTSTKKVNVETVAATAMGAGKGPASSDRVQNAREPTVTASSVNQTGESAGDDETSPEKVSAESIGADKEHTTADPMDADGTVPASSDAVSSDAQTLTTVVTALPPPAAGEYDTLLPTTKHGIMIKITVSLIDGTASFNGYNRFPNGSKAPAELDQLCGDIGDRVIAVDGRSVLDKSGGEIVDIIRESGMNEQVHLRFRTEVSESSATTSANPTEGENARDLEEKGIVPVPDLDCPQKATQSLTAHSLNQTKEGAGKKIDDADKALGVDGAQTTTKLAGDGGSSIQNLKGESIGADKEDTTAGPMDADGTVPASRDVVSSDAHTLSIIVTGLPPLAAGEYDTLLPSTKHGLMIKITVDLIDGTASFNGYKRFPNGLRAPAERKQLCGNIGDRVIAVDGASVLDKSGGEIVDIILESGMNKQAHVRFRTEVSESPATTSANPTEGENARDLEEKGIVLISDLDCPQKATQSLTAHSLNQTKEGAGKKIDDADKTLGVDGAQTTTKLAGDGGSSIQNLEGESIGADKKDTTAGPMDAHGTVPASRDVVSSDAHTLSIIVTGLPPLAAGEYDTLLPSTKHGIMINVKHGTEATFNGYAQKYGLKGPAELRNLCRHIGDRVTAVDGLSVLEKDSREIADIIRENGKKKQVHVRFRTKGSESQTTTSAAIPKNPLPQQPAVGATPRKRTPTTRDEPRSSPAGLAMLEALQNEASVTLTSPLASPKNVTKLSHDAQSGTPIAEARHFPPRGETTRPHPPVDNCYNTIPAATIQKQRPANNGAAPLTTFNPPSMPDRTEVAASKTIVRSGDDSDPKRRRLNSTKLTGKKMRTIQAKWNNEYRDRELQSITAVAYAMELNDVKQQEQARKYLKADNMRYRRAQERKNRPTTSTTPTSAAQHGKRPPPAARTADTAKRRKQTSPKRPPLVYADSDPTTNANKKDSTIWLPTSAGRGVTASNVKAKSPRMTPKIVYEGPPFNDAFQTDSSWPEAWKATKQWPKGWMLRIYERRGGASKGHVDRYWFSPKTQKKLRSIIKVKRFVEFIGLCDGDEGKAWARLRIE